MATTSAIDVVMPQMGVSVSEGTITKWLKQEGEPVAADESLLEISTDKVDTEVPSPGEGILQQILVQEGETVDVGTKLAVIAPEGAAPAEAPPVEEAPPAQEQAVPAEERVSEPATAQAAAEAEAPSSSEGETPTAETAAPAEPAVVVAAREWIVAVPSLVAQIEAAVRTLTLAGREGRSPSEAERRHSSTT